MKIYKGRRLSLEQGAIFDVAVVVTVDNKPLKHHFRHSPDGFNWGYGGSGPADLARSILWDLIGLEPYPGLYQTFKWKVVAKWGDVWQINSEEIQKWISENSDVNALGWYKREDVRKKSLIEKALEIFKR